MVEDGLASAGPFLFGGDDARCGVLAKGFCRTGSGADDGWLTPTPFASSPESANLMSSVLSRMTFAPGAA